MRYFLSDFDDDAAGLDVKMAGVEVAVGDDAAGDDIVTCPRVVTDLGDDPGEGRDERRTHRCGDVPSVVNPTVMRRVVDP